MWISFAARILKPASSMRVTIWPATPLAIASGLMIASVRSTVIVRAPSPRSLPCPPAGRRRLAADEGNDGFRHVRLDERRALLLGHPVDLTDHHDRSRLGVV